jgi:hypothetical protein
MDLIDGIRDKIATSAFELSQHAVDQTIARSIDLDEVEESIVGGEVIEDYPEDKYGPSCLNLGFTRAGRPLHVQASYPTRPPVKIITVYEPDPTRGIDFRTRRP